MRPIASLDELANLIDLSQVSHGAAPLTKLKLELLARTLHRFPYAAVADRLAELGIAGPNAEALWLAVRGNLSRLDDAADPWRQVAEGDVAPIVEDADYLRLAASMRARGPLGPVDLGRVDHAYRGSPPGPRGGHCFTRCG